MESKLEMLLISSQLPVSKWYEYFNNLALADAIMDRVTTYAIWIELKEESMRRKKSKLKVVQDIEHHG